MSERTEYFRLYFREARQARKRLGLCVQCGQQPAIPSRTRCGDCNNDQKQADARYRHNKPKGPCQRKIISVVSGLSNPIPNGLTGQPL